ncbi:ClpP family protease [Clostridium intestinale]|jgi:ATP-dependent protease ClpP protease subunit|uniref:ATP-dependent Clp protease proteolytic subunit n=1 Tax=Clostridium intestinale TaxID=36845 RepID=A0A7D7A313_9CLOT|nr:ATP-dependent Clp protease proteolytic subunit [Clostridium intestinale]QLY82035.1 ATP-dependent Clp protease proteolytic subunit [Clostridium intestinale]
MWNNFYEIDNKKLKDDDKIIDKNEDKGKNETKEENDDIASIKEFGNTSVSKPDERIQIVSIIGQIEGHMVSPPNTKTTKYEHVIPQLISMEQNPEVKGILIILNTVGGDVEAGLAIAEMVNSLSKPTVSLVIGGGHSIGVPLATSANVSFISPSATMIIHPIRMNGLVIGVPQTFKYFNKMQDRINDFIVRTSKVNKEKLKKLMMETDELLNDMGTILIGKEAVDIGLIDEVGGIKAALDKLESMIE